MLKKGKAHIIYPSKEIRRDFAIEENYILPPEGEGIVLCEIPEGGCPHPGGEGIRQTYTDSPTGSGCICNLNGQIDKRKELLDSLVKITFPETKVDSDKPNPRKRSF